MTVANQNLSYFGSGAAVASGSTTLAFGGSSLQEFAYAGTVTFTGDNSATTANINYIDGSNALGFTPSAVLVARCGGNAASSIVVMADGANISNTACPVIFSAAPGTNATVKLAVLLMK